MTKHTAEHVTYIHSHWQLQLCYIHVKIHECEFSFLITLIIAWEHKNSSYLICVTETRLLVTDSCNIYAIQDFDKLFRNDLIWNNTGRSSHGLVEYIKESTNVLEQQTYNSQFWCGFLCIQYSLKYAAVQLIMIYASLQCKYRVNREMWWET